MFRPVNSPFSYMCVPIQTSNEHCPILGLCFTVPVEVSVSKGYGECKRDAIGIDRLKQMHYDKGKRGKRDSTVCVGCAEKGCAKVA